MNKVRVYSTGTCPVCVKAKAFLDKRGIDYDEVRIDLDRAALKEFSVVTNGARTVPQIVVDGKCIGGFSELTELHMEGGLDHLLPNGCFLNSRSPSLDIRFGFATAIFIARSRGNACKSSSQARLILPSPVITRSIFFIAESQAAANERKWSARYAPGPWATGSACVSI
jgi:glutaredoxin 3